jgi:hypothetical protein
MLTTSKFIELPYGVIEDDEKHMEGISAAACCRLVASLPGEEYEPT